MKIIVFILTLFISLPSYSYTYNSNNKKLSDRINDLAKKIEISPNMNLYLERAKLYIDNKEYSYAVYDLNKVIKEDSYNLEAYVLRAKAYFLNDNYNNAKKSLNEVFSGITYDLYKGTSNNLFAEAYYIRSQISKNEGDENWQADYEKAISMGYKEKSPDEEKSKKSNTNNFNTGSNFGNTFKYLNQ